MGTQPNFRVMHSAAARKTRAGRGWSCGRGGHATAYESGRSYVAVGTRDGRGCGCGQGNPVRWPIPSFFRVPPIPQHLFSLFPPAFTVFPLPCGQIASGGTGCATAIGRTWVERHQGLLVPGSLPALSRLRRETKLTRSRARASILGKTWPAHGDSAGIKFERLCQAPARLFCMVTKGAAAYPACPRRVLRTDAIGTRFAGPACKPGVVPQMPIDGANQRALGWAARSLG